jgi:hypothetical protein
VADGGSSKVAILPTKDPGADRLCGEITHKEGQVICCFTALHEQKLFDSIISRLIV